MIYWSNSKAQGIWLLVVSIEIEINTSKASHSLKISFNYDFNRLLWFHRFFDSIDLNENRTLTAIILFIELFQWIVIIHSSVLHGSNINHKRKCSEISSFILYTKLVDYFWQNKEIVHWTKFNFRFKERNMLRSENGVIE